MRISGTASFHEAPLFEVDLRFEAAEWVCLLGASGCGKSTLLRLLAGLETGGSFSGEIAANRAEIAWMGQADNLAPWLSARGNVALGSRLRGEAVDQGRVDALLARVGLFDDAQKRPAELSGGMRQRAALARTLYEDRACVLMDEPFSALDAITREDMQDLAFELLKGRRVILVTHDPQEALRLGHRVLVMRGGLVEEVAIDGAPLRDPLEHAQALRNLHGALRGQNP